MCGLIRETVLNAPMGCFVTFSGWTGSNGKRYDDGMLIFNLGCGGETVTMTTIWE